MNDAMMEEGQVLLSVFEPPPAFSFQSGLMMTHDLNWGALVDEVAAALCRVEEADLHRRRRRLRAQKDLELRVLYAGDRFAGGPHLHWATAIPIAGRRLHAKAGLLRFVADEGIATCFRAYVSSANVTPGGLGSNRELVVWDDLTGNRKTHLARDIADAFRVLVNAALHDVDGNPDQLRMVRRWLLNLTGKKGRLANVRPTGMVTHSLAASGLLLAKHLYTESDRTVIVSPAFASKTNPVAHTDLESVLVSSAVVHLVVPADSAGTPHFSRAALNKLKKQVPKVRVFSVPESDPSVLGEPGPSRVLHAKLIGTTRGNLTALLIGSSNFTSPGLTGQNRELLVRVQTTPKQLQDLMDGLRASEFEGEVGDTNEVTPSSVVVPLPELLATLRPSLYAAPGAASWPGELELVWGTVRPSSVWHDGTQLKVAKQQTCTINGDRASLDVQWPNGQEGQVAVFILASDEFWLLAAPGTDEDDPDDRLFRLLFRDLAIAGSSGTQQGQPGKGVDKQHFTIPLDQRLVRVVRARAQIDDLYPPTFIEQALRRYLLHENEGEESLAVAQAVLASRIPFAGVNVLAKDSLLRVLMDAVPQIDASRGN